jgi:putative ABC transport system permease protein
VTQVDITQTRIDVLALDPIVGDAQPTLVAGRSPRAADEIALGARTMREKSTGLGRLIEAKIGDNAATYRVVGQVVFPEFGDSGQLGTGAQMTVAGVRRLLPTAPRDNFYLRFSGRDAVARQDDVAAILNPLPAHTDARPEDLVNLARGDGLLLVLGGLLGLLALAMLVHTVVTAVRSARRSHAVLRALGYSRRQSEATVLWQSLALAVAALGVGLPAGLVVGRWVWIAYANHLGMPSDPYVPSISVVLALVGTTVVALLAAAAPGWIVARTNVARTLHAPD